MARKSLRVSTGEMEILGMLWASGEISLGTAHERFGEFGAPCSYPTMQTRLNRMVEKGLVSRSDERPALYTANVTRDQVTVGHLRQLIDKLSQGDIVPLVAQLLGEQKLSEEQYAELEGLLRKAREGKEPRANRRRGT